LGQEIKGLAIFAVENLKESRLFNGL